MGRKHNTEWWYTDPDGRRIGWLWPEDFSSIMAGMFGEKMWAKRFSEAFDLSYTQTNRWRRGEVPIPKLAAYAIMATSILKSHGLDLPDLDADASWLPLETNSGINLFAKSLEQEAMEEAERILETI